MTNNTRAEDALEYASTLFVAAGSLTDSDEMEISMLNRAIFIADTGEVKPIYKYSSTPVSSPPERMLESSSEVDEEVNIVEIREEEPITNQAEKDKDDDKEEAPKQASRGTYRRYTEAQKARLIDLYSTGKFSAAAAARQCGIHERTGQKYIQTWREEQKEMFTREELADDGNVVVKEKTATKKKNGNQKLFEEHTEFLIKIYEDDATLTLNEAKKKIEAAFEGLSITTSALQKHMVKHCSLTMKKLERIPAARNEPRTIELRAEIVGGWIANTEMDFLSNCVFIDEAGFSVNARRTRGRSKKGEPAKATVLTQRGVTYSVLGAISADGVLNFSMKTPKLESVKKRKTKGAKAEEIHGRIGTRTTHFLMFLQQAITVLAENNMKNRYFIMDNAPIHKSKAVAELLESHGHHCAYLPPYSPFLNPIEECWSKLKAGVIRSELCENDSIEERIIESSKLITKDNCIAWIKHAQTFFDRCLAKESNL